MPSARTHDFITLILAAPTAAVAYELTADWGLTAVATAAMLFGGLMFGPDLDIQSKQYARWGPFRFLWWPYRVILPHRSRFSHGILLGTLIRVVYFITVITIVLAMILYVRNKYLYGSADGFGELTDAFRCIRSLLTPIRRSYLMAALAGLWIGATSHTVSDLLGSFFKNLRRLI
jgi:uncharacterized metal-binding protein